MPTVLPLSLNALSCLGGVSPTDSAERNKLYCSIASDTSLQLIYRIIRVHFGITVIIKLNTVMVSVAPLSSMILTTLSVVCMTSTTVRSVSSFRWTLLESISTAESTIITLADWYHDVSLKVSQLAAP